MAHTLSTEGRREVLLRCGATPAEADELLAYNENHFVPPQSPSPLPLPDEPFVEAWRGYAVDAGDAAYTRAVFARFPQLNFPVRAGIGETPAYLAATRQGVYPRTGPALSLHGCTIHIHPTPAGSIPVVTTASRDQFVWLVQAFTKRNEPVPIPDSMGACFLSGYTNWDRVHVLRDRFCAEHPPEGWNDAFKTIKADKALYQDRFIVLSTDAYSGVPAEDVGASPELWAVLSRTIRLEHECVHYFTRRVFGSMRNNVLDELIADYFGICAAINHFRSDWLLRFWGLQDFPTYREGGRLQNYKGTLSQGAFAVLQQVIMAAVSQLKRFDDTVGATERGNDWKAMVLSALVLFPIEAMAHEEFPSLLHSIVRTHQAQRALDSHLCGQDSPAGGRTMEGTA